MKKKLYLYLYYKFFKKFNKKNCKFVIYNDTKIIIF